MLPEERNKIITSHYSVLVNVLGDDAKACDFMAWTADFFFKNPTVLKEISNPKTRDKVFSSAVALANNPILKSLL